MPQNPTPDIILQNFDFNRLFLLSHHNAWMIHTLLIGIASSCVQLPMALALSYLEQQDDDEDNTPSYNGMLKWLGLVVTFVTTHWYLPAQAQLDEKYPFSVILTPSALIAEKQRNNNDSSFIENKILLAQYIHDLNEIIKKQEKFFSWIAAGRFFSMLPSMYHGYFYSFANNSPAITAAAIDASYVTIFKTISSTMMRELHKEDESKITQSQFKVLQYVFRESHMPITVLSMKLHAFSLTKVLVKMDFSYQGTRENQQLIFWTLRQVLKGYVMLDKNNYTALVSIPFYPSFDLANAVIQQLNTVHAQTIKAYPFFLKLKKTLEHHQVPFEQINSIECSHTTHVDSLILYNILDPDFLSIMETFRQAEPDLIQIKDGEVYFILSRLNERTLPLITQHLKIWRTTIDRAYQDRTKPSTSTFEQGSSSSKPPRNPNFIGKKSSTTDAAIPAARKTKTEAPLPTWPLHDNAHCIVQKITPINDEVGGASIYIAYPHDFATTYSDPEIPKQIAYDKEVSGQSGSGIKALRNKKGQITAYETTDHHSNTRVLFIVVDAVQTPREDNAEKMKTRFLLIPFVVGNHKAISAALEKDGKELQASCEILKQQRGPVVLGQELRQ